MFHSVLCFEGVSTIFGKVYVKDNYGIVSLDAGIMSYFSYADREKNKIDIEEENSGGDDLKKDLVQAKTGISNPFSSNIKVCSDEDGNSVHNHPRICVGLGRVSQAVCKKNNVEDAGLIEKRNNVSICSHFLKTLSISGLENSLQVDLVVTQEDI